MIPFRYSQGLNLLMLLYQWIVVNSFVSTSIGETKPETRYTQKLSKTWLTFQNVWIQKVNLSSDGVWMILILELIFKLGGKLKKIYGVAGIILPVSLIAQHCIRATIRMAGASSTKCWLGYVSRLILKSRISSKGYPNLNMMVGASQMERLSFMKQQFRIRSTNSIISQWRLDTKMTPTQCSQLLTITLAMI